MNTTDQIAIFDPDAMTWWPGEFTPLQTSTAAPYSATFRTSTPHCPGWLSSTTLTAGTPSPSPTGMASSRRRRQTSCLYVALRKHRRVVVRWPPCVAPVVAGA